MGTREHCEMNLPLVQAKEQRDFCSHFDNFQRSIKINRFNNNQNLMKSSLNIRYDVLDLVHWSLTHGIIMSCKSLPPEPTSSLKVTHAPFTLHSYNYPQEPFDKAKRLAPIFNSLIHKISKDYDWLLETLTVTAKNDNFTGRLLEIYKIVSKEGVKQKICFGINRSDYMLHSVENDNRSLLQVEINTIASSFGSLSTKISEMYRRFECNTEIGSVPTNSALEAIADGLFQAHTAYMRTSERTSVLPIILIVVQPGERNVADQRLLHYAIEELGVQCRRATLDEIFHNAQLHTSTGELLYNQTPVSVVYFRAGYTPDDYVVTGSGNEWDARLLVERSLAIKCPNIAYHLAGTKKVQQALAQPGVLEKFVPTEEQAECIPLLRSVFAGLFSLDPSEVDPALLERAVALPDNYVLKPQREGGGNNLYGDELVQALRGMSREELSSYILMERIRPPHQSAVLVRDCVANETDCLCELGVFGVYLSDEASLPLINKYAGYLLRVKPAVANEGGVAAGYAVLSSPRLC